MHLHSVEGWDMKEFRFNKGKAVVLFTSSILLGLQSPQVELQVLSISAPTLFLTDFTMQQAAKKLELSKEEKDFVKIAKRFPQTQNEHRP